MYKRSSRDELGTLSQLQECFNRKNFRADVMSAVNPDRQFLGLVTSGYVVIAMMEYLQMESKDERPANFREGMNLSTFPTKLLMLL